MISSSSSSVTPTQELARLTLISPGNEEAIRRRSTTSISRPHGLGEINGAQVLGPLGPPIAENGKQAPELLQVKKDQESSDAESERTLVADNKETESPTQTTAANDTDGDSAMPDIPGSDNPPPVPPRNAPTIDKQKLLKEEVEIGAQQDVTEVINNVLFQSQCAIKPRGFDEDGEQLDQIKE